MSVRVPPRLLELAGQSLLRDEASAIAALELLPPELFPPLFMEAFTGRHTETLKAMVQAWPFARLPLGGLMQTPHQEILQAALDGLDVLLAQKVRPRRWKLQVLDLRNGGQNFWSLWSGAGVHVCSPMGPGAEDSSRSKQPLAPLKVFVDLCLKETTLDEFLTYLITWVKQREGWLHLCCKKLRIFAMPIQNIEKVLNMVQLDCIQQVEVNCPWQLSTLGVFAPYLGRMSNVQRLLLAHIHAAASEEEEQQVAHFTSQVLRLHHLRGLYIDSPSFLEGCLDQMLRCLKTPLETLSITNCQLTESDLTHLSHCLNISQLQNLDLSGISLTYFSPEPLQILLEKVAATLQNLDLDQCGIADSHLEAILPALSHCSQLRTFSMCGNPLSMAIMGRLLRHTDGLHRLRLEVYPAPLESYSPWGALHLGRLAWFRAELIEILRDLGRPRTPLVCGTTCCSAHALKNSHAFLIYGLRLHMCSQ
uniref:Uncharacterized protein n=1 Tax=Equus asinus asinus TaxID=83772 RepID=A0A8C4PQN1_EQUAS